MEDKNPYFSCKYGFFPFRHEIKLYDEIAICDGQRELLSNVTGVRWGIDKCRGGIFPKYVYRIAIKFGDREYRVNTSEQNFYVAFTESVMAKLLPLVVNNLCSTLKKNGKIYLDDDFYISDEGLLHVKKTLLGMSEELIPFTSLQWSINAGMLFFKNNTDEFLAGFSLMNIYNVHALAFMLRKIENEKCLLSETCKYFRTEF